MQLRENTARAVWRIIYRSGAGAETIWSTESLQEEKRHRRNVPKAEK